MGKKQNDSGREGEKLAIKVLRSRGVLMAEKIGTPVILRPVAGRKNTYVVKFGAKVSGDVVGILKDGTRVLCETKTISGDRLHWSRLRPHQPERLDLNKQYNGVSLLVWVSDYGVFVMDWNFPNEDFGPGRGMTLEYARAHDVMSVKKLGQEQRERWENER